MSKDEVYKNEIHPLMDQILSICKTHQISFYADFSVGNHIPIHLRSANAYEKEHRLMVMVRQCTDGKSLDVNRLLMWLHNEYKLELLPFQKEAIFHN